MAKRRKGFEPDPKKIKEPPSPPQGGSGGLPKPPAKYDHNPGPAPNEGIEVPPDDLYLGVKAGARKPCVRCQGTGVESTALERWGDIDMTMRCYQWPATRIEEFKATLKPDDILVAVYMYSVTVESDGEVSTFYR